MKSIKIIILTLIISTLTTHVNAVYQHIEHTLCSERTHIITMTYNENDLVEHPIRIAHLPRITSVTFPDTSFPINNVGIFHCPLLEDLINLKHVKNLFIDHCASLATLDEQLVVEGIVYIANCVNLKSLGGATKNNTRILIRNCPKLILPSDANVEILGN